MIMTGMTKKKGIAAFFLTLLTVQIFYPATAFALTSGPSQPEMQKFQPAGASDMVDLFSGDFKYNIPLMDVGGYPLNLAYHSGGSVEDEGGWVGMGWTLNPGTVNRTMRGIPDDFTGDQPSSSDPADKIETIQHRKEFKKIGGQLVLKPTLGGWEFGSASIHLGVYKDNYFGIGAETGASISFNTDRNSATTLTAGLGLSSDSRTGVTLEPSFSLTSNYDECKELNNGSLSGGFTYNTRAGLEKVNLGQSLSFNTSTYNDDGDQTGAGGASFGVASFTKYFSHTYTPTFSTNTTTSNATFNLDLGPAIFGGYLGVGGSGYVNSETNAEPHSSVPAYGYLNYSKGRNNVNAILDFNREKDGVFLTNTPAIPVPVSTEDYFEATSQAGSVQFRPVYNGDYTVFDRTFTKRSSDIGAGLTIGSGNVLQGGARVDINNGLAITRKWTKDNGNNYLNIGEPDPLGTADFENVYFKRVGEHTKTDESYYGLIGKDLTEKVALTNGSLHSATATSFPVLQSTSGSRAGSAIQRNKRDIRTSSIRCLTARQASAWGLDRTINGQSRIDAVHKPHHLSEITVTDDEGKRMVYGIPVYNIDQEEVSFSVETTDATARKTGLVGYTPGIENTEGNNKGRENIYNKKSIPPYATSYLLTGILSPDYVDKTGDGITDDDLGTAIKFNYQKSDHNYNWRAPFEANKANYNEGYISDKKDDKANYVFGQRETWYLQTINSKTMVAQFFTSPRNDAFGSAGEDGGRGTDAGAQLMKLDSIRLFSKADLLKNTTNAVPIKVAHFVYDYSICPGLPNNVNGQGKLTLKQLYFTFGTNGRGQSNPYLFTYDQRLISQGIANLPANTNADENTDSYTQRLVDRWGAYKQSFYNPGHVLNNSEFPYSLQVTDHGAYDERLLADRLASKWQLTQIYTPTAGIIFVEYESDDYSYVQDRKAMVMCPLSGVGANGQNSGLVTASKIYVGLPVKVADRDEFNSVYLSGPNGQRWNNIFFKVFTDIDNKGDYEYVYGYAGIDPDNNNIEINNSDPTHTVVGIPLSKINGFNPISKTAWQMLQNDLPQYAYENYDNSDVNSLSGSVSAVVKTIIQSFANLKELFQSFDVTAKSHGFANKVDLTKSMIRLNYPVGKINGNPDAAKRTYGKLGGGSRVRTVELADDWNGLTGAAGTKNIAYGLQYDYTTTDDKGQTISSGVAAYEPQIGNEENPFHEPLNYTEKVQWGLDRYHYVEKPFGESYFPGPSVGYSSVKVTNYGRERTANATHTPHFNTGYTVGEFYTARDFPTQVDYLPLEQQNYENDLTVFLFASKFIDRVTTSQGFKIMLNDMHGKEKATKIYDKAGSMISSTEYFYNVDDENAQRKRLNNTVLVLDGDGTIPSAGKLMATDADLVTDVRESSSTNTGTSIGVYAGFFYAILPIPYGFVNYNQSASIRSYNSISSVKVIHQYGLLKTVRTTQNGSTLTATNLLWDAQTGDVLLTQNQNEFDDNTYSFHYPAYRVYDGMGSAYQNAGIVFTGLMTDASGNLPSGSLPFLSPGDELADMADGSSVKGWIIQSNDNSLRLIDQNGQFISGTRTYMIVRSGRRNMLNAAAGTVVSQTNPLVMTGGGYQLQVGVDKKILDAKALTFKDEWAMPVPNFQTITPQEVTDVCVPSTFSINHTFEQQYLTLFLKTLFLSSVKTSVLGRNIFAVKSDGVTLADLVNQGIANGLFDESMSSSLLTACSGGPCHFTDLSQIKYYLLTPHPDLSHPGKFLLQSTDQAYIGTDTQQIGLITFSFVSSTVASNLEGPTTPVIPCSNVIVDCDGSGGGSVTTILMSPNCATGSEMTLTWSVVPFTIQTGPPIVACNDPLNQVLNPYFQGVKGNWRADSNFVYQVNRTQVAGNPGQNGGTNIRTSGSYNSFTPFWTPAGQGFVSIPVVRGSTDRTLVDSRWVWSNQPVHFDQKGNEIENVDALKRYSSALYGYQQSLATAVAANARHNEIAFDGFEDYYFNLQPSLTDPCPLLRHFDMGFSPDGQGNFCASGNCIVSDRAHSGNYSLHLSSSLTISKGAGASSPAEHVLGFDGSGKYILTGNELAGGFAPVQGKQYLLSLWVNDGDITSNHIQNFQININGIATDLSNITVPVVEGWKKLDVKFTAGASFTLQLQGGGNTYIDDLRILPFDAQLKSFVYDDKNMRLVGQLDENNFGVFYEYDEEGTPIRTKKETERGVMTVKENRQSLRPIN